MKNLHNYYYKDYFSDIDFSIITKKEELEKKKKEKKELENKDDPATKNIFLPNKIKEIKRLEEAIKDIEAENQNKISGKNKAFTAKGSEGYTQEILKKSNPPCLSPKSDANKDDIIELKVHYPGLVTGVGIDHEAKIEGEFKLGVHFDWTHGMPVVYGSSVKGVLRAWFKDIYLHGDGNHYEKCGKIEWGDLLMEIFEGAYDRDIEAEKKKYKEKWEEIVKDNPEKRIYKHHRSIYERDIFFDAVISKPDTQGRILCSDSITPHGDNPLKNPIPITFLKIAPGCTMEFRFKLNPSTVPILDEEGNKVKNKEGKEVTLDFGAKQKKDLFQEILTTVGVGAKTNVGYGQLKEAPEKSS